MPTTAIQFFGNTKDDLHCYQACMKMLLRYNFLNKAYSFKTLDRISGHKNGKWTWQGKSLVKLSKMGFSIVNIENLNYKRFSKEGEKYLSKICKPLVFKTQKRMSDFTHEKDVAKRIISSQGVLLKNRRATISDIKMYLNKGWFIFVSVNPLVLSGKVGYGTHFVVPIKIAEGNVIFHDPGNPPHPFRSIPRNAFVKSMSKKQKDDSNLIAFKLNSDRIHE